MKLGLQLSFETGKSEGEDYMNIFENYIKFSPLVITEKYKCKEWDKKKYLKSLGKYDGKYFLAINDDLGNIFSMNLTGTKHPHFSIAIEQDEKLYSFTNEDVVKLFRSGDGFTSAYLHFGEYTFIQSEKYEGNILGKKISSELLDTIRNTPYKLGVMDHKEYDVRFNPGRMQLIGYTWLVPAWKMWFGKQFFKLVPKERLLSFPHASEIKELSTGEVYVQLYDKIEEPHTPENVFRQWKWREWLDFDSLEEKYS